MHQFVEEKLLCLFRDYLLPLIIIFSFDSRFPHLLNMKYCVNVFPFLTLSFLTSKLNITLISHGYCEEKKK